MRLISIILLINLFILLNIPWDGFAQNRNLSSQKKKRDPFVALVTTDGKIKSYDELFEVPEKKKRRKLDIVLKAIIWDDERPLAMIGKKVYAQGDQILEGVTLQEINPNSIKVDNQGDVTEIPLRKKKGDWADWVK